MLREYISADDSVDYLYEAVANTDEACPVPGGHTLLLRRWLELDVAPHIEDDLWLRAENSALTCGQLDYLFSSLSRQYPIFRPAPHRYDGAPFGDTLEAVPAEVSLVAQERYEDFLYHLHDMLTEE